MLIIEEGADGEWGAASTAAGGMLGHSYPVATVMQAGYRSIQHTNQPKPSTKMAAAGSERRPQTLFTC